MGDLLHGSLVPFAFMVLLSVADLSFHAVPATAGSYVVETILARLLLKEQITSFRFLAGVMLVMTAGVALLAT